MAERQNTFLLKRSNVPGKVPSPGDIKLGEVALNTADVILYASGTTANSILPIGWDRISRTGDTVTGDFNIFGDVKISGSSLPGGYALSVTGDTNFSGDVYVGGDLYYNGDLFVTGNTVIQSGLTANTIFTDYIDFNTGATVTSDYGRIYWDNGAGTLNISVGDAGTGIIDLQVGQEEIVRVYNAEATTLQKGEIVYVSGSQGNRPRVKRASAVNDGYSVTTLGMVDSSIASGTEGYVTTFGIISNLNTLGLTGGTPIWLSPTTPGAYTTTKPQAPYHTVLIGYVVRVSATVGSIFINISNGWELDELHDVRISAVTSGDLLIRKTYNGSPVWVNSKTLNGSYGITGGLNVTGLTETGGITSTGGIIFPQKTISSTYSAQTEDYMIDASGGTFTVYLPSASGIQGKMYSIKNNGGGAVTVQPYGSETIDNKPFITLGETNAVQLISNGIEWVALGYNVSTVNSSTGVFEFTGMTKVSNTTFNVSPVKGWIVDDTTNPLSPQLYYVDYSGGTHTDNYVTTDYETFVYLTSGGTIAQQTTPLTEQQRRQNIFLGKIDHPNKTSINLVFSQPDFVLSPLAQLRDMFTPINLINGGVLPSANGANLKFNTSAGYLYGLGINFSNNILTPSSIYVPGNSPTTFQYRTQTGGTLTNVTDIDPLNYDVGGVKTAITGTKATNQRIYLLQDGTIRVMYGQHVYNTLTIAISSLQNETFTPFPNFVNNAVLIGVLSVLSTATDLTDTTKAKFFFTSKFGETVGAAGGSSVTTLQQAYNNSSSPEIVTNSILNAVQFRGGTGNDTDKNISIENNAGTQTAYIRGDGKSYFNTVSATTISATTYLNLPINNKFLPLSGGTVTGNTTFKNYLIATTLSAATWLNLPPAVFTGGTVVGDTIFLNGLTASTISATTYLNLPVTPFSGGTVTGPTIFTNGLTANTISATTYLNLPEGVFISGSSGSYSIRANNNTSTDATGNYAYAEGSNNIATGISAHAEGTLSRAYGVASHAEGTQTTAIGDSSHAEGFRTTASGSSTHTEGGYTTAIGTYSHAEGYFTIAKSQYSHAEGWQTTATGESAHAEGYLTSAYGDYSHAEGEETTAIGNDSHAEGYRAIAEGNGSHAEGFLTTAVGLYSHVEGYQSKASGEVSHVEGRENYGIGDYSHTEGRQNTSVGYVAHAEGLGTTAFADYSHAQNWLTKATGMFSHAEGVKSTASNQATHAGGSGSTASGISSFIHSNESIVSGNFSAVIGGQNITGTSNNTVYVPNLNINTAPANDNSLTQVLVRAGDGTVKYKSTSSFTDIYVTGGTYSNGVVTFTNNVGGTFTVNIPSNYSAGPISGSTGWSSVGNGQMNLPALKVALFDNANNYEPVEIYSVSNGTTGSGGITGLTNNDTNYIVVDYNGGTPIYKVYDNDGVVNDSSVVLIYIVYRADNFIHVLEFGNYGTGLSNKLNDRLLMTDRFGWESGLSLGLSGSTGVVTLSSGVAWNASYRQSLAALNSQDDIFFKSYHSGGTWTYNTTGNTLNNTYYDNGTNPVVATSGKYLVNWYFRGQEVNDHLYEVYGTDEYDNVADAQLSVEPILPELVSSHAFLTGRIIVKVGENTGYTESAFVRVFQSTQVTNHNDLLGIQGGSAGEYYHLSSTQYNNLAFKNVNNNFSTNQSITGNLNITGVISGKTSSGINWISGATSTDLVRITQNGSGNAFVVEDSTNPDSTPFIISNTGSVGIGKNPSYKLDVADVDPQFRISASTNNRAFRIYPGSGTIEADNTSFYLNRVSNTNVLLGFGGGNIGVGTISSPTAKLHVVNTGTSNSFLVEDSVSPDSTPFVIDNSGNVGIGTSTPSQKLDIIGKTRTSTLQVTSGATLGYLLTSDASGNATWQANAAEANTASNVGGANGIFYQKSGVDLQFRSLSAGTNITITSGSTKLTINTTAEANTASNLGSGNNIFAQKSGVDLQFRSIIAGTNITITSGATSLTIDSTASGGYDYGLGFAQSINNFLT